MSDYYDSPIIVFRPIATKFEEDAVNEIMSVVQEYKLDIDKEQLIAVLKQDQKRYMDAYRKGYEDCAKRMKEEGGL